ncbi:hypothetical protein [Deinococcus pimensis]|uniref:hypothetical protein n=1 Tax=Deinococcus pimensis TaxID=309888 RepID=UPI000488BBFD|nr:hypothetical protein [Deinococcus pimensis]
MNLGELKRLHDEHAALRALLDLALTDAPGLPGFLLDAGQRDWSRPRDVGALETQLMDLRTLVGAVKEYEDVVPGTWRERRVQFEARYGVLELPSIGAPH